MQSLRRTGRTDAGRNRVPSLENGDRLSRSEFERRYAACPTIKKAELIEGVVYMPSPVRASAHGGPHFSMSGWLSRYAYATPYTSGLDNATLRLDGDNEPQPDLMLRIVEGAGGRSRVSADDYVEGAPELVVEVAGSSASYDLHDKLNAYRRNGVQEYLVLRTTEPAIDWFELAGYEYRRVPPRADGIVESRVFPGLWLDVDALLRGDMARVVDGARQGIESAAHGEFVERLSARMETADA